MGSGDSLTGVPGGAAHPPLWPPPVRSVLRVLLALAGLAALLAVGPRIAHDRAQGWTVELAAELGAVVQVADREGRPVAEVLESFARAGLTSVIADPAFAASLEAERGPALGRPGGPRYAPLLRGRAGQTEAEVEALLDGIGSFVARGVVTGIVVFDGEAIPGYPAALGRTVAGLKELGLEVGLVEDPSQLSYVPLAGTERLAALLDYAFVRIYHPPAVGAHSPERVAAKIARSVKERSLRAVWLDLYGFPTEPPAWWTTRPGAGGETGLLAANLRYVEEVRRALERGGFQVGPARPASGAFTAPPALLVVLVLGPWAATLLTLDLLSLGRLGRWRRAPKVGAALTAALVGLTAVTLLGGWGGGVEPSVRKLGALWAALVYPTLAGLWVAARWFEPTGEGIRERPHPWLAGLRHVGAAVGVAVLGGLVVAGFMAEASFAMEIQYFRGVKLSYVVPPVAVLGGAAWLASGSSDGPGARLRSLGRQLRFLAGRPLEVGHVFLALAVGLAAVVYVGRSGDQPWLPVTSAEVAVRTWLDRALYAQPRLKEFLVGHPALILGTYLAWTGRRRWLPAWAAVGAVGLVSVVNSFEHVRTPLALTFARTANGALLGLALGLAAVWVTSAFLPRQRPSGGSGLRSGPDGPGSPSDTWPNARPAAVDILGVRIHRVSLDGAVAQVSDLIREAGRTGGARLVFTPNPEMLYRASRDASFRAVLNSADLLVPDGVGVVLASRVLSRRPLATRVAGVDLLTGLFKRTRESGPLRVFLLGSRPGVAARAAAALAARYPGLRVVGTEHGYFTDDDEVVEAIRAAGPELLVAGLGSPKQELWLAARRGALGGVVAVGAGGSLDVLSGDTRRAPAWVRRLNLEWLYRILSSPRARLRRVPALAGFVLVVLGAAFGRAPRSRMTSPGSGSESGGEER